MSFVAYEVERRTRKGSFYAQIDSIIDWKPISAIINKHYQKGLSASGEKPYDGLLLFKMLLTGMWNTLSRRACKRQSIGDEILRYAAGRLCSELQCFKPISFRAYRKESLRFTPFENQPSVGKT
nr:hypothetical protein [Bergeyella zoohelcum]